ncbi:zinc finger protein [Cryptococcus deuterogattii MMRL2647]|nr:zinc finger protein [Cryptococcus deuterogattii MMRL2647]
MSHIQVPFPDASPLPSPTALSTTSSDDVYPAISYPDHGSESTNNTPRASSGNISSQPSREVSSSSAAVRDTLLPIQPMPDSLLLKHTLSALDASATTLKRFSKSVLAYAAVVHTLSEQLEKAEDDLFGAVGELGRWLETGYGVQTDRQKSGVWDQDGIRKVNREKRRREREEMNVRVEQGLKDVKAHLKRRGLAGGGAQTKYESSAKQFYHATGAYLAPQSPTLPSHTQQTSGSLVHTSGNLQPAHDMAQAVRLAQWDLTRYTHHSALLSAVPPSSEECLNLLVGLYGWVASMLNEQPGVVEGMDEDAMAAIQQSSHVRPHQLRRPSTPAQTNQQLKSTLSSCLSQLSSTRARLLLAWARRDDQTRLLQEAAARRQIEYESTCTDGPSGIKLGEGLGLGNIGSGNAMASVSSSGVEHKKLKKHKFGRSMGRLKDFLSPSSSSHSVSTISPVPERPSRASFDGLMRSDRRNEGITRISTTGIVKLPTHSEVLDQPIIVTSPTLVSSTAASTPTLITSPLSALTTISPTPTVPYPSGASSDKVRHSMDSSRPVSGIGYSRTSPNPSMASISPHPVSNIGLGHPTAAAIPGTIGMGVGGYRDSMGPPGGAHAVIDLKFASVREGRGTGRRFVFEIVTPSQGRRLYQATSDQEMKQWLYAICNAIESCINGTSTVRTIDHAKARGPSGAYDDHALPTRSKYNLGFSTRNLSLGLVPLVQTGRKSMPPTPVEAVSGEARTRKTSFKKVLKQSGERFTNAMIGGTSHANLAASIDQPPGKAKRNSFGGLEVPRPTFGRASSRQSLPASAPDRLPLQQQFNQLLPAISTPPGAKSSWADNDIESRVLKMAGLGLGASPPSRSGGRHGALPLAESPSSAKRRVKSEAIRKSHSNKHKIGQYHGEGMTRSKSDDGSKMLAEDLADDKKELKRIAAEEGNARCADCHGGMKASRWATISLHNTPIVLFLCIRCIGIHRSLGTHISKARSVDMDIWTLEQIALAREWGNIRGNAVWEATRGDEELRPNGPEEMKEFIKQKYVEGRWLRPEDRPRFGFGPKI